MNKALQLTHTRVGDIPLLLGLVIKLGIPEIYDREIGDHGSHVGLSGGWMLAIWIVFILTESDHTKYKVEEWIERHAALLSRLSGQQIRAVEFNDNRLSSLLSRLSKLERWERFEASIWQHSVSVYEILQPSEGRWTARSRLGGPRTEADTICWTRTRWRRAPEARNCHAALPGQERSIRPKGGRRRRTPTGLARAALERAGRGFARDLRDALSRELARRTQLQPDQGRADRD